MDTDESARKSLDALPEFQPGAANETLPYWVLVAGLLIAGVILVCCAESIGVATVRQEYAPGSFQWNANAAGAVAEKVRMIGLMLFVAGLVERLAIAMRSARAQR